MHKISLRHHPIAYFQRKYLKHRHKKHRHLKPQGPQIRRIRGVNVYLDLDVGESVEYMYFNAYEFETAFIIKKYLKPGGTFLDVGANVGYFSALAMGHVGTAGQVHCFEPVPKYYACIEQIARLNPDHQLFINRCALGNEPGQATIYIPTHFTGGSTLLQETLDHNQEITTTDVPVRTLDDYLNETNLNHLSLVKIDVEGFELPLMEGFAPWLRNHRENLPPILLEISPFRFAALKRQPAELFELIENLGYELWCICDTHPITRDDIRHTGRDVMLHPKGKKHPR